MRVEKECEHKFIYKESYYETVRGPYLSSFIRTDEFFCERCLEIVNKIKRVDDRDTPAWYKR